MRDTQWSGPSTWDESWWINCYPFLSQPDNPEAHLKWLLRGVAWGQAVRCTRIFHPCMVLPYSCFTSLAPHFCSKELPFLIKKKYRHLRLSDAESWKTLCFPKSHFPFHQPYKFILFSVISVKRVRHTIAIHMSTPPLLPPTFPGGDFNFCKDLEAQDIFRKPFNHTFQFRSHWSHVSM